MLSHYVGLLTSMLKGQVLHHSAAMATATLETMAMATDQVPDVMRVIGGCVLSHSEGYRETLQMLKLMYTWQPTKVCRIIISTK